MCMCVYCSLSPCPAAAENRVVMLYGLQTTGKYDFPTLNDSSLACLVGFDWIGLDLTD